MLAMTKKMDAQVKIEQDINALNNFCEQLAVQTAEDIKLSMVRYTSDNATGESINKIKGTAVKKSGECYKIAYKILRYDVFFYKGVGKGRGINSGKTKPRPFMDKPMNESTKKLTDFLAENMMDRCVNIHKAGIR